MNEEKRILLIVTGSVAAYKSLDLVRELKRRGIAARVVLTKAAEKFVTAMSFAALSGEQVFTDMFSLKDETEIGHIRLSREADLVVVAPASADIMAKMVAGIADDLATTLLLATDKEVMLAPAMNVRMWEHPATQNNARTLRTRGVEFVGPGEGEMACGEFGEGRMAEVNEIAAAIEAKISGSRKALAGFKALVTAGPTFEEIDPVRFIGNYSSGKQGYAIAEILRNEGAEVTLISGPVAIAAPSGINLVKVKSASEMKEACEVALPCDVAVFAAAVADYRPLSRSDEKIKKEKDVDEVDLSLVRNEDILAGIAKLPPLKRPKMVIGFAAETGDAVAKAKAKLAEKSCDMIIANDVSEGRVFGEDKTTAHIVTKTNVESLPEMSKIGVAREIVTRIAEQFNESANQPKLKVCS